MTSHYERTTLPSLEDEMEETIRSLIKNADPETITHALLLKREDLYTIEGLAAAIGRPTWQIEGTVVVLEDSGLLKTVAENGHQKYTLTVPAIAQPPITTPL